MTGLGFVGTPRRVLLAWVAWAALFQSATADPAAVPRAVEAAAADETPRPSRYLVVVRLADDLLSDSLQRDFSETAPVHERILGADVRGQSHTHGELQADLSQTVGTATFHLIGRGESNSSTVGYRGPARIHSRAQTRFAMIKTISFSLADGVRYSESAINARTRRTTVGVAASVPGLRGAIVRRVASCRVGRLDGLLEQIANEKAKRRITAAFDRQVARRVAEMNAEINRVRPILFALRDATDLRWVARTEADAAVLVLMRTPEALEPEEAVREPRVERFDIPPRRRMTTLMEVWLPTETADRYLERLRPAYGSLQAALTALRRSNGKYGNLRSMVRREMTVVGTGDAATEWTVLTIEEMGSDSE